MIAKNIRRIMNEKLLKQSLVAIAAGYSVKKFNDMLCGRATIKADDITPICKALGVTPNDLFADNQKTA